MFFELFGSMRIDFLGGAERSGGLKERELFKVTIKQ